MADQERLDRSSSLDDLFVALTACQPAARIDLREEVLAFGAECVSPLVDLALGNPDLAASGAAWLEVLAKRDPTTKPAVVAGLRRIARAPGGDIARGALARLGASEAAGSRGEVSRTSRTAPEAAVHGRVRQAAREGRLITYGELETSRGHVGTYLLHLSQDEAAAGRPPITSIVVSKGTMRPGDGYLPAMVEVGFARAGESAEDVWHRAVAEVFAYWATQPSSAWEDDSDPVGPTII